MSLLVCLLAYSSRNRGPGAALLRSDRQRPSSLMTLSALGELASPCLVATRRRKFAVMRAQEWTTLGKQRGGVVHQLITGEPQLLISEFLCGTERRANIVRCDRWDPGGIWSTKKTKAGSADTTSPYSVLYGHVSGHDCK